MSERKYTTEEIERQTRVCGSEVTAAMLRQLLGELREARGENERVHRLIDNIMGNFRTLEDQLQEARENLRKYGKHDEGCRTQNSYGVLKQYCTCGLTAALERS